MKMYGVKIYTKGLVNVKGYTDKVSEDAIVAIYDDGRKVVIELDDKEKQKSIFLHLLKSII